jgi:predicted nucleic acid-binding protein
VTASVTPSLVVIDTSVWVSRVLTWDSNHAAAHGWVQQYLLGGGHLTAPALLVTEVAAAVARQTKLPTVAQQIASQLYSMPSLSLAGIDQQLIDTATDLAANLGLRGADALFVALALQMSIPLVTFDKEQLSKPASIIGTIQP